jgi:hypothetical protein
MNSTDGRTISDHETRTSITARRGPVVSPPASHSGGPEFKPRPGNESAYEFHGFYRVPPGRRQDSNSNHSSNTLRNQFAVAIITLRAVQPETAIATYYRNRAMFGGTLLLCATLIPNLATTWSWSASPGRTPTGIR